MEIGQNNINTATQQTYNTSFAPNNTNRNFTSNAEWETSAESLARQQIMAEIAETKVLLQGSVTPDAAGFWKKHLEELNERLVALVSDQRRQVNPVGGTGIFFPGGACGGVENDVGAGFGSDIENMDAHNNGGITDNHVMVSGAGGGGDYPCNDHMSGANAGDTHELHRPPHTLPMCEVVAPSDLPGGYMFEAQLGSKKFLATVPPGGATKGQRFISTMRELETIEILIPLGAWRDGTRDCLADGLLHPLFLNALCLPCIALGQIMTRTRLDWHGKPASRLVSSLSCVNMTVLLTFWLAMNTSAAFMLRVAWERGRLLRDYYMILMLFNIVFFSYMVNLTRKVRGSLRHKYQIPEEFCSGTEDCLCATFCMPCTICQIGRHTADFNTYRATCCTSTGLPQQVELAPVTLYEDQYHQPPDM